MCIPKGFVKKEAELDRIRKIWLIAGNRRIKIFGNSGISHASCDKMIKKMALTLPGGKTLPLSLEIETTLLYEAENRSMTAQDAKEILSAGVEQRALEQMQAGQILERNYVLSEEDECFLLSAMLECHEMIAQTIEAKWNNEDYLND